MAGKKLTLALCLCSITFISTAQKAKLVSWQVGTTIKVLNRNVENQAGTEAGQAALTVGLAIAGVWAGGSNNVPAPKVKIDTIFVGIDSGYYKCRNDFTLLLLERDRHATKTQLLNTGGVNVNKKRYVVDKLTPIKYRKGDEAFISVDPVAININPKRFKQFFYENYSDYLKGNIEHQYVSEKSFDHRNTIFQKDLERFLAKTGHVDTTGKISLNGYKIHELKFEIRTITEHKFEPYCLVEINTLVQFPPAFGLTFEKTYTTYSNIGSDNSPENECDNWYLIGDAVNNVIAEILKDPEVNLKFLDPAGELKKLTSWEEIALKNKLNGEVNLENSVNAVVTITRSDGHGSGCIVSSDGYIITNYHVVGVDTSDVHIIFNSGLKKRCRFIRGNPSYDLALLRIDTTISVPLKINTSNKISIGADVYAIGTPRDVSLGQTITKGIISAKRKIDDRIYIQSDASVNKGNSGGALTNKEGELIGIVNSKLMGVGVEGVSFAIPAFYIEEALGVKIKNE